MRLIDVNALGVGRCSKDILPAAYCAGWNGLIDILEKADTVDAVVVTHCKDCRFNIERSDGSFSCYRQFMDYHGANDFCSYGEPKEGAHADDHN